MPKNHLIICCNRNMRVNDWTPFDNNDIFLINSMIVKKGDLISSSLDRLNMHNWELSNSFAHKSYIYFVLKQDSKANKNEKSCDSKDNKDNTKTNVI